MYKFGTVVLIPFPFTNLESSRVRPAVILSRDTHKGDDIIVAFITSNTDSSGLLVSQKESVFLDSGLKVDSTLRFDKLATLHKRLILGELGRIAPEFLRKNKKIFDDVFGF